MYSPLWGGPRTLGGHLIASFSFPCLKALIASPLFLLSHFFYFSLLPTPWKPLPEKTLDSSGRPAGLSPVVLALCQAKLNCTNLFGRLPFLMYFTTISLFFFQAARISSLSSASLSPSCPPTYLLVEAGVPCQVLPTSH